MNWRDKKPFLRQESCWRCKYGHSTGARGPVPGKITEVYCTRTKRWGSIYRACYCEKWKPNYSAELYCGEDGIPVRNKTSLDYRTKIQWGNVGRVIKDGAVGLDMHPTMLSLKTLTYYLIEDTLEAPPSSPDC